MTEYQAYINWKSGIAKSGVENDKTIESKLESLREDAYVYGSLNDVIVIRSRDTNELIGWYEKM